MKHGKEKADILKKEFKTYKAFSYYCGGNYGLAINQLCRYGHQTFGFKDSIVKELIELMKKEILKYNIYENIIAFRVLDYNDLLNTVGTKKIIIDQILIDNGFMGVGLVKDELIKEYSGYDTMLQIYIPKECNGLYLDLISNRSEEQEILFFPGSRLKVLSNKKHFRKQRVIVCEMLISNVNIISEKQFGHMI